MVKLKRLVSNIPLWSKIFFCVFPVAAVLHLLFAKCDGFAEVYCVTVGHGFRTVLASLTNIFPMSLAEAMLIFLPFVFVAIVIRIMLSEDVYIPAVRIISGLLSVITLLYSLFVFTFAAGFYVKDIGEYFGLKRRDITLDELYDAALFVVNEVNAAYDELEGKGVGATKMGMDYDTMNDIILDGFNSLYGEYGYPKKLTSRVKPIVLSEPMTYTHVSGVYTYFTGEANINVNYPDFVIPYTAAHELSHQRGVSREDEANFTAFLVCIRADDPYIRYSGYLNMYEYMISQIAAVSPERYAELNSGLNPGVIRELMSYSRFFDKYRESVAGEISDSINDSYLSVMAGTDSRSYGMVVDLATVYIIENN